MNTFIKVQCINMISSAKIFKQAVEMAAKKDDGTISKDEAKTLKAINKATDNFISELQKIT